MKGLEIVFVLLGWVAVGLIVYTVYINMELRALTPEIPSLPRGPRFLFFYAPWCPWSKKAKPHWDRFEEDMRRYPSTFGGHTVRLEIIDSDRDPDTVKRFHVTAYPSFKLESIDGITYDYPGHPSADGFRDFLAKHLGKEEPMKLVARV